MKSPRSEPKSLKAEAVRIRVIGEYVPVSPLLNKRLNTAVLILPGTCRRVLHRDM